MSSKNKKKILVTGVAGFLGSHLSEKLVELGHNVIGVDNMIGGYEDNVPKNIEGVDSALLNPLETWESQEDYQMYLDELVKKFQQNFKKFDVGHDIISAGPKF